MSDRDTEKSQGIQKRDPQEIQKNHMSNACEQRVGDLKEVTGQPLFTPYPSSFVFVFACPTSANYESSCLEEGWTSMGGIGWNLHLASLSPCSR